MWVYLKNNVSLAGILEPLSFFLDDVLPFFSDPLKAIGTQILNFALPIIPDAIKNVFVTVLDYVYV